MLILRKPRAVSNLFFLRTFISSFSRAWNPYFFRFILGSRIRKFTILDHVSFYFMLKRAFLFIETLIVKGAKGFILNEYQPSSYSKSFMGFIFNKWTPGMLTNVKVLQRLVSMNKLRVLYPFFLMVVGVRLQNVSLLMEAKRLRIPTIAFLNAYFGHWIVDYPILGNMNKRAALYYMYIFEEMRLLTRSAFLHRYVFRRSKQVYRRQYIGQSALIRESNLTSSISVFERHSKELHNSLLTKFMRRKRTLLTKRLVKQVRGRNDKYRSKSRVSSYRPKPRFKTR